MRVIDNIQNRHQYKIGYLFGQGREDQPYDPDMIRNGFIVYKMLNTRTQGGDRLQVRIGVKHMPPMIPCNSKLYSPEILNTRPYIQINLGVGSPDQISRPGKISILINQQQGHRRNRS